MMSIMNTAPQSPAGWVPELASPDELFDALEKAFDYRGDVSIVTRDDQTIEGYLYDRRRGSGLDDSEVRIMPSDGSANASVRYADIARLTFADRDPAAGKSWENWLKRYAKAKLAGEKAEIKSESLD